MDLGTPKFLSDVNIKTSEDTLHHVGFKANQNELLQAVFNTFGPVDYDTEPADENLTCTLLIGKFLYCADQPRPDNFFSELSTNIHVKPNQEKIV